MKNIIFDIGFVLVVWDPDLVYKPYFNGNEKLMQNFYNETGIFNKNKEIDQGRSFTEVLIELATIYPHYQEPILFWKEKWPQMIKGIVNESVDILRFLYHEGYSLFGLSNWSKETFPIIASQYDFWKYFQDIIISGEVKEIKPNPKIYKILLEKHRLTPTECLFIDDNIANVQTARSLNMHAILFKNPKQLTQELSKLGINCLPNGI